MRVNQGLTLLIIAIFGIVAFYFLGMDDYIFIFSFLLGVSIARFDSYWIFGKSRIIAGSNCYKHIKNLKKLKK